MRILVTFAIKAEFAQWSSRHPFVPYEFENWETRREFDLFKANIGHDEITVLLTGIGSESASRAMQSIPLELHDLCISSGLAGSLDPSLTPGTVIVARSAETLDQSRKASSDPALLRLAIASGAIPVNLSLTSEKIIASADEKESLGQKGNIVEMESVHILAAAGQKNLPGIIIRAVSDAAGEDMPVDFSKVLDTHGHLRMRGLLKEVGFSPYRIPLLIQFGRQSRAASKSLADFLDRYIAAISQKFVPVTTSKVVEVSAT